MCNFFSFNTDGCGNRYYFDWKRRQSTKLEPDSHASIAKEFHLSEDKLNKYEYYPLTKIFHIDQINNEVNDSYQAEEWVRKLDFKTIIEPLIINEIINPFKIKTIPLSQKHKRLLKECISSYDTLSDPIKGSIKNPLLDLLWNSTGSLLWESIWSLVRDSVQNLVMKEKKIEWEPTRDSVWFSVFCYLESFYDIIHPFDITPWIELWNDGYVPSLVEATWRLHCGPMAKIVYQTK